MITSRVQKYSHIWIVEWIIRLLVRILVLRVRRRRRDWVAREKKKNIYYHVFILPGLVLPATARDAGALHQHIPSFDVLQAADVATSRRSGSRTRSGRDLRPTVASRRLGSPSSQNFDTARRRVRPYQESPEATFVSGSLGLTRVASVLRRREYLDRSRREKRIRERVDFGEDFVAWKTIVSNARENKRVNAKGATLRREYSFGDITEDLSNRFTFECCKLKRP
jgi:hypothetical protein